jgi:hypothetical protein
MEGPSPSPVCAIAASSEGTVRMNARHHARCRARSRALTLVVNAEEDRPLAAEAKVRTEGTAFALTVKVRTRRVMHARRKASAQKTRKASRRGAAY